MKTLFFFLTFCSALSTQLLAQIPPQAFNYSAVARNAAGQPIASATIGIQISILKGSTTGTVQYSENHFVNTDAFGLFNLVIGSGAVQSGSMAAITWSNDNYYLKVGMDANGGTNFLTMGTTQLLSVPYAQHAKTAESLAGGVNGGNFSHFIGEIYGGGIIFHLWKDSLGVEHGLIMDTVTTPQLVWSNVNTATVPFPSARSCDLGLDNSNAIIAQAGHTNSAATVCLNSTNGGYTDWYLPTMCELEIMYNNRYILNKTLKYLQGNFFQTQSQIRLLGGDRYWSSNEVSNAEAWYFNFDSLTGTLNNAGFYNKQASGPLTCPIRAF